MDWIARFDVSGANDLDLITEVHRITAARLLIAQGRPTAALSELDELEPQAKANARWGRVIEILALRAVGLDLLGKRADALIALGRALALAEPEGYIRRFADDGPTLIVAGQSGPEIAESLAVAPSAVKTHLKNIYDKLGVHSRDQAISRVRELKLLK